MEVIIRSGVIVTGLLFIRKLAMGKISRKFQYYMWGILPVVLLIFPYFRIPAPALKENASQIRKAAQGEAGDANTDTLGKVFWQSTFFTDNQGNDRESEKGNDLHEGIEGREEKQGGTGWKFFYDKKVLRTVRMAVMLAIICFILGTNGIFAVKLFRSRIFLKKDGETKVRVYLLEECGTPFLFGRSIYLHPNMTENAEAMRYMILHEYCHLKQGDLLFSCIKYFLCAVYWFDPFVWLAISYFNRDCELACDEAVTEIIGADRRQDYGMTLLKLLKGKRGNKRFAAGISMGGKKSLMRERILFLSKPLRNRRGIGWTLGALAGCILLTGCSLMGNSVMAGQRSGKEPVRVFEKQKASDREFAGGKQQETPEFMNAVAEKKADEENHYYNNAKENEGTLYFTQEGYLCGMDLGSKAVRQLEKGNFLLGSIDGGYLYYMKYPADGEEESGIGRMHLTTMERRILLPWEEKYWSCTEIFSKDGCLYLGLGDECEAFLTDKGQAVKAGGYENKIAGDMKTFKGLMEEAPTVNFGYINSIFNFHVFTLRDSKTDTLYICDTKAQRSVKKTGCLGDVLVCEYGVVYLALNGDIYLSPLDNLSENRLLFSAGEDGKGVTYGTYDKNGLYVFENDGKSIKCKCILWKGGIADIKEFPGTGLPIKLKLSAFTDYVVYFENEKINLV